MSTLKKNKSKFCNTVALFLFGLFLSIGFTIFLYFKLSVNYLYRGHILTGKDYVYVDKYDYLVFLDLSSSELVIFDLQNSKVIFSIGDADLLKEYSPNELFLLSTNNGHGEVILYLKSLQAVFIQNDLEKKQKLGNLPMYSLNQFNEARYKSTNMLCPSNKETLSASINSYTLNFGKTIKPIFIENYEIKYVLEIKDNNNTVKKITMEGEDSLCVLISPNVQNKIFLLNSRGIQEIDY